MRKNNKFLSLFLALVLLFTATPFNVFAYSSNIEDTVSKEVKETAEFMLKTVPEPGFGTLAGEWTVLSLARSGEPVPKNYFENYYKKVEDTVKNLDGNLHDRKFTEYSRVIVALTSIGKDPRDVAGYDLVKPLSNSKDVFWQGINGPIWGLIAVDTKNYDLTSINNPSEQNSRDAMIKNILDSEVNNTGGWNLFRDKNGKADPDITAMALYSLAPYKDRPDVNAAIERGVQALSDIQLPSGGYKTMGSENSESSSQVIIALTSLGIDPHRDIRFIKYGYNDEKNSVVDALLKYKHKNGGYTHVMGESSANAMGTDQAMEALVSLKRFYEGKPILFDMSDVELENTINLPVEWIKSKSDEIAGIFSSQDTLNDVWKIMEMAKYHEIKGAYGTASPFNEETKEYIKSQVFKEDGTPNDDMSAIAKSVLAVRAAGMDPENYYGHNLVDILVKSTPSWPSVYSYGPALNAISSDKNYTTPGIKEAIDNYIKYILDNRDNEGLWDTKWGLDATGFALYGLAPHYDRPEVKAAIDNAVEALKARQLNNGDFTADQGNSNTLSMIAGGISGVSTELVKDISKNGNTMYDALEEYDLTGGLKYKKNEAFNAYATEQGFRALVAFRAMNEDKSTIFDYTKLPKRVVSDTADKSELEEAIKNANDLKKADKISVDGSDIDPSQTWVTEEVNNKFNEILNKANEINKKVDATQKEVDDITESLIDSINSYKPSFGSKLEIKDIDIPDEWINKKAEEIYNLYLSKNSIKNTLEIVDTAKYYELKNNNIEKLPFDNETLEFIKTQVFDTKTGEPKKDMQSLSKNVLAVRAAGMDPEDYYGYNLVELLINSKAPWESSYIYGEALIALNSDKNYKSKNLEETKNSYVDFILNDIDELGLWNSKYNIDTTGTALYSLAPYYNDPERPDIKKVIDKVATSLPIKMFDNADFYQGLGDSNTLSNILGGLASANPELVKVASKNGNTMFDALMDYDVTNGLKQYKESKHDYTEPTELGFRALVTYLSKNNNKGYVYDLTNLPKVVVGDEVDKKALEEAIVKAQSIEAADKTSVDGKDVEKDKTWVTEAVQKALDESLENAIDVFNRKESTQEEVNVATNALTTAIENYKPVAGTKEEKVPVDKKALEEAIVKAQSIEAADKTSVDGKDVEKDKTWVTEAVQKALDESLENAIDAFNRKESTQEEVNAAIEALTTAIENYKPQAGIKEEKVPVDKKALEEAIVKAQSIEAADKTSVDGKDVEKDKTWVTEAVQKALDESLENAIDVFNRKESTQEEVNVATNALTTAIENYKPVAGTKEEKVPVDKKALEEAIVKAQSIEAGDKTSVDGKDVEKDKTWVTEAVQKALDESLENAIDAFNSKDSTQEEVNTATDALNTAIENYKPVAGTKEEIVPPVVIDKTELEKAIKAADELPKADLISEDGTDVEKEKTWVTEEVNNALNSALTEAKKVMANDDATEEEVNAATNALTKATENYNPQSGTKEEIVPPAVIDKTELEKAIKAADELPKADLISKDGTDVEKDKTWVTEEATNALNEALTEAKNVMADEKATQEVVNKAKDDLTTAIENYKPQAGTKVGTKPVDPRPVDPKPVDPRPVDPIYPRPSRPEGDRYDYGHNDYAPFLPGLGFITPGRVYTTTSVDTRPIETKPINEIKPVVPVFTDIIGHWAEPAINSVVAKDYFKGTGVDTFSPNRAITRSEIVTVLGRIAGVNPANYTNTTMTDVEHGSYYEGYVNWAVEKGIVNGVGENKFDPNSEASREEVATIISRYLDMIGKNNTATSELSYKDSQEISQWAKDAVNKLTELGVFNGQDGNKFAASESITRAEIAQVIYNMDNANLIK